MVSTRYPHDIHTISTFIHNHIFKFPKSKNFVSASSLSMLKMIRGLVVICRLNEIRRHISFSSLLQMTAKPFNCLGRSRARTGLKTKGGKIQKY